MLERARGRGGGGARSLRTLSLVSLCVGALLLPSPDAAQGVCARGVQTVDRAPCPHTRDACAVRDL